MTIIIIVARPVARACTAGCCGSFEAEEARGRDTKFESDLQAAGIMDIRLELLISAVGKIAAR